MASRVQQDTFIDDSDDACPLCVEEFDLSDKNFRPCPCGYQVCQFCYNNIKNNMNGLCPACRRPYDEKSIEWKIVSPEEFKADVALQARKKAAARQKEAERRQVETLNRKHLAGLRVVQKNLVYVVGLNPKIREEDLMQTLRGEQYFGQYGKIIKISVSKAKELSGGNQSIGVYVTFARKQDAASCIAAVDGSQNGDRTLRAQYGTTKYCSAYLRNEICNNRGCMFLHETGEDNDSFSRQDLSSMNAVSTQRPAPSSAGSSSKPSHQPPPPQPQPPPQQAPQAIAPASQPLTRQIGKDEAMSRSDSGDGSALPTTANWAKNPQIQRSRRSSQVPSHSTPSPKTTPAKAAPRALEDRPTDDAPASNKETSILPRVQTATSDSQTRSDTMEKLRETDVPIALERALKTVLESSFAWSLDRSLYDEETLNLIDNFPPLIDVNGGAVRHAFKMRQESERLKEEEEERNILQAISAAEDDDNLVSGSLQLGGEPETQDNQNDAPSQMGNGQRNGLQQRTFTGVSAFDGQAAIANDFSNISFNNRSITPQQQQHLMLLKSGNQQNEPVFDQFPKGASGNMSQHQPQLSNPFQATNQQLGLQSGHTRHASRFTFANDSASASAAVKPATNAQLMAQQSAMMPSNQIKPFSSHSQQQPPLHTNFYSGVQGPPPGLKSSGTPPISGGGMFGQGHGFASSMGGSGFGNGNLGGKTSNDDLMRELLRGRSGVGNGLGSDTGKREYMFPSFLQKPTTSTSTPAPAPGLLSSLYGSQLGAYSGYHDQGLSKQKKKGKKHRHANTSSSGGGGIVDLADPSILQARMHHGGAGQGQYGGNQGQESLQNSRFENTASTILDSPNQSTTIAQNKPSIDARSQIRASSPVVPPGLCLPQDFPPLATPQQPATSVGSSVPKPPAVTPIVPLMPIQLAQVTGSSKTPKATDNLNTTTTLSTADPAPANRPVSKTSAKIREDFTIDINKTPSSGPSKASELSVEIPRKTETKVEKTKASELPRKLIEKHQRPEKLDLVAAKDATKRELGSILQSSEQSRPTTPISKITKVDALTTSPPSTPATIASQTSSSTAPRQIHTRTIRVVQTPKAEIPPRLPTTGVNPTIQTDPTSKEPSRQPSLASIKQPGTPLNEIASDIASVTSTSQSRPGSPPPSKVGSAPIRQSTKSQQKKDRQARARLIEGSNRNDETAVAAVPEEPIQAPIIGRKKKTKKATPGVSAEINSAGRRPSSPGPSEEIVPDTLPSTPTTPIKEAAVPTKASNKEPKKDAAQTRKNVKESDSPRPPNLCDIGDALHKTLLNAATIFAELQNLGQIPHALDLFRAVPGVNYRYDLTESDLTEPNALPPITESQRHTLDRGDAICVETSNDKRVVILPDRRTLRGFSPDQAKRYLDLRKQYLASSGPTVFNSARHSIERWLHNALPSTMPFETSNLSSHDSLSQQLSSRGDSFQFVNHFDSLMMTNQGPTATMGYWSGAATGGDSMGGKTQGEEGRAVGGINVEEAERALGIQRKETEALEKRLGGLVRKNRKLLVGSGR